MFQLIANTLLISRRILLDSLVEPNWPTPKRCVYQRLDHGHRSPNWSIFRLSALVIYARVSRRQRSGTEALFENLFFLPSDLKSVVEVHATKSKVCIQR